MMPHGNVGVLGSQHPRFSLSCGIPFLFLLVFFSPRDLNISNSAACFAFAHMRPLVGLTNPLGRTEQAQAIFSKRMRIA